jgi:hypothetical protein
MTRCPAILATAAIVCLLPSGAAAWKQSKSSSYAPLHWKRPCISVYVSEAGSSGVPGNGETDAAIASMEAWSTVACTGARVQFGGLTNATVTGYMDEAVPANIVIWREDVWPYVQTPVAFTSVTYDPKTGEIVDADIELNGVDFAFSVDTVNGAYTLDVRNTLTHEFGHVLGLDHSEDAFATMYSSAEPGETFKSSLEEDDRQGLCTIYPVASAPKCEKVTPAFLDADDEQQASGDDGCALGGSASGAGTPDRTPGPLAVTLLAGLVAALWALLRAAHSGSRSSARPSRIRFRGLGVVTAVVAAAAACLVPASPASAWHFESSSTNATVHREPDRCRVPYFIDIDGIPEIPSDGEFEAIHDSLAVWTDATCSPLAFEFAGFKAEATTAVDQENVIRFVSEGWNDLPAGDGKDISTWAAFTLVTYVPDTGAIVDADMLINLEHFTFSLCQDREDVDWNLSHVVLHEAGHMVGMAHSEDPLAVMWPKPIPCNEPAPDFLTPDDEAGFCWMYGRQEWADACLAPPDPEVEEASSADPVEPTGDIVAPETGGELPAADTGAEGDGGGTSPDCGDCAASSGNRLGWTGPLLALLAAAALLRRRHA